jgi:choice-of-anchor C domain-containing protein
MKRTTFVPLLLALVAAPSVQAANIIESIYGIGAGSFELPGHTGPMFVTPGTGSNAITGWTVNSGDVDWVKQSVWNASQGIYSIDLNGDQKAGKISTVIPTTAGTTYRVTFDIAGFLYPGSLTNPKRIEVEAGEVLMDFSLTATQSYNFSTPLPLAVNWETRGFDFVASGPSSTLSFKSLLPSDGSAMLLDNVSVTQVSVIPEPSASALVAFSVALGLRRRRNRR